MVLTDFDLDLDFDPDPDLNLSPRGPCDHGREVAKFAGREIKIKIRIKIKKCVCRQRLKLNITAKTEVSDPGVCYRCHHTIPVRKGSQDMP